MSGRSSPIWKKGPQGEDHIGYSIKDVLDAQFYTDRSKQWYTKTLGYFQAKYDRKEIENAPVVADKTGDPQVKVKGKSNRNLIAIKCFKNGTVLLQGSEFMPFCKFGFQEILQQLNQNCLLADDSRNSLKDQQ